MSQIVDANGTPVPGMEGRDDPYLRQWFAGRVPASLCDHYITMSEARAGFTRCERCGS
jgi:hypothetical protein